MKQKKYISRFIEFRINKLLKQFPCIVLTGPRQSGKSTTLKNLLTPSFQYFSLEEPTLRQRIHNDPVLFFDRLSEHVIFDEIQYIPEILIYVKMAIDKNRHQNGKFVLTGSQQFVMMKNISETLAGRTALLHLLPLGYLEIKNTLNLKLSSLKIYLHSCLRGSYPELITHRQYEVTPWYDAYIQTYIERDVRGIYNIGNLRDFQRSISLLASQCSQQLNMNNIANDIGLSVNTIKNWISILEASYIVYLLKPFYQNLGKRIIKSPKLYFMDNGLLSHFLHIAKENQIMNHPLLGALFENYCIQEIIKYFEYMGNRPSLYYMKTKTGHEIDLLIETNKGFLPVEIKFTRSPNIDMAKPMEYFYQIKKFNLLKGFIICLIDDEIALTKNIHAMNIHFFLEKLSELLK